MKKIKLMAFKALFIILGLLLSQQAFAMKCINSQKSQNSNFDIANVKPDEKEHRNTTSEVKIIADDEKNVIVWRADYSITLTCYYDEESDKNETIKIFLDDVATNFFKDTNLSVGIIYNGEEHIIGENPSMIDTKINGIEKDKDNCKYATSKTITINYSLFFKSKSGKNKLEGSHEFTIFRIGGKKDDSDNFSEWINLSNVIYVECVPNLINQTQEVQLGEYAVNSNKYEPLNKVPFTITANISGTGCADQMFRLGMYAPTISNDNKTIKTNIDGVGIQIFKEEGEAAPLRFQGAEAEELLFAKIADSSVQSISKTLYASVIFTKKPEEAGEFNGTLNYQLWIK